MPQKTINRQSSYMKEIEDIYEKYTNLFISYILVHSLVLNEESFSFYNNYLFTNEVKEKFKKMYSELYSSLKKSINSEWEFSNQQTDNWVKKIKVIKDKDRFFKRNNKALDSFFSRKRKGLNLSQRVWKLTNQHRKELELSLDVAIREGKSSQETARTVKKYLNNPDVLHAKARSQGNKKTINKLNKEYNTGQGVYKSSQKNALRLTRTETNIAYKTADIERWQLMDFVVGYEVKRSNNKYSCPICESLAGKYPKSFKFVGWHPQCRCFIVPILMNHQEMILYNNYLVEGKKIDWTSKNNIDSLPDNMLQWVRDNKERINKAKTLPYFIRDNKNILLKK